MFTFENGGETFTAKLTYTLDGEANKALEMRCRQSSMTMKSDEIN